MTDVSSSAILSALSPASELFARHVTRPELVDCRFAQVYSDDRPRQVLEDVAACLKK